MIRKHTQPFLRSLSIALCLLLWSMHGLAAYRVSIALPNRSTAQLHTAFKSGALALITQLSGSRKAAKSVSPALTHATSWVASYTTHAAPDNAEFPWVLDATYSKKRVDAFMREHQIHTWPSPAPSLSFELRYTNGDNLVSDSPIRSALQKAISARGLGQQTSSTNDQLIITMPQPGETEQGIQWAWLHNGQWQRWLGNTESNWLERGVERISTSLAKDYGSITSPTSLHLQISGVRNFSDYALVLKALNAIPGIQNVTDDGVNNDQVLVDFTTIESMSDIKASLDKVAKLTPYLPSERADFSYYWGVPLAPPQDSQAKQHALQQQQPTADNNQPSLTEETYPLPDQASDEIIQVPDNAVDSGSGNSHNAPDLEGDAQQDAPSPSNTWSSRF